MTESRNFTTDDLSAAREAWEARDQDVRCPICLMITGRYGVIVLDGRRYHTLCAGVAQRITRLEATLARRDASCTHESLSGIDATDGADKPWFCHSCRGLFFFDVNDDLIPLDVYSRLCDDARIIARREDHIRSLEAAKEAHR